MVKKVTNEIKQEILDFLNHDPVINCYMISDIESLGLSHPSLEMFVQMQNNNIQSVLMFFNRYGVFYTESSFIEQELLDIIKNKNPFSLSGGEASITILSSYIKCQKEETFELSVLKKQDCKIDYPLNNDIVNLRTDNQLEDLYYLLKDIKEFNVSSQSKDSFIEEKKIINKAGNSYGMYSKNELCCTASTLTETQQYAVINGVATKSTHRKKGYASQIIDFVIHEYIHKKNKELILYYNNKDAANIYINKGFKPYGVWKSLEGVKL